MLLLGATVNCGHRGRSQQKLVVAVESPITTLDRRMALGAITQRISMLITPGLTRIGPQGEAISDLADSWSQPSPEQWVVTLRKGILFSDGTPLTSRDVVATFRGILDPAVGSPFRATFAYIKYIEPLDPWRVKFELTSPNPQFLIDLTIGILPEALTGKDALDVTSKAPIGAGPYRVERFDDEMHVWLSPNPFAGPDKARLPLEIRVIPDENARTLELIKGRTDVVFSAISPSMLPLLRKKHLNVQTKPGTATSYLMFNMRHPILKNRLVREAIALTIPREAFARFKLYGTAHVAHGLLPEWHGALEHDIPKYAHDPERAMALLDMAGYPDPDGAGPLPRMTLMYKTSTDRLRRAMALIIVESLRHIGIELRVETLEWGTFFSQIRRGQFDLSSLQWTPVVSPDIYRLMYHSQSIPREENHWTGGNRMGYQSLEVDRWLDLARSGDESTAKQAYKAVQKRTAYDLPAITLLREDIVVVSQKRVRDLVPDPYGSFLPLAKAHFDSAGRHP